MTLILELIIKWFCGLKFHDFDKTLFFKVVKINFFNQVTDAQFLNFNFCILFNHDGIEMQ